MKMIYFYSDYVQSKMDKPPIEVVDHPDPTDKDKLWSLGWNYRSMTMAEKAILLSDDMSQEIVKSRGLDVDVLSQSELAWILLGA